MKVTTRWRKGAVFCAWMFQKLLSIGVGFWRFNVIPLVKAPTYFWIIAVLIPDIDPGACVRVGFVVRRLVLRKYMATSPSSVYSSDEDEWERDHAATYRSTKPVKTFSQILAHDALLITRLTVILLKLFGFGWKWITSVIRLFCFIILLLPAFLALYIRYLLSDRIRRAIRYASKGRSFLDIYIPHDSNVKPDSGWPVVVFFPGGAWIIGHRAWPTLMGWRMAQKGIIFVAVDYRNFPQGEIIDMLVDANNAISYVFDHIHEYGGDVRNVTLAGQSAGAHLSSLCLLRQSQWERVESRVAWKTSCLRRFIGVSGPYNLEAVCQHLHGRGLYRDVLRKIMGHNLSLFSPACTLMRKDNVPLGPIPDVFLFHGDADRTVPYESSIEFGNALRSVGVNTRIRIYEGKTHTDMILEDSMAGFDPFLDEFIAIVKEEPFHSAQRHWSLCSAIQIKLARFVNPF